MAPRITVITAALNALGPLKRTLASVAAQTIPVQHIVIDGASTDGTPEYLASVPGLIWRSEPDTGIANALNKGLALASGDYVLVLQAGDGFLMPRSLEYAIPHLTADFVAFDVVRGIGEILSQRGFLIRLGFKPLHHQGVFTRRALFEWYGNFDESFRICMDYEFQLRAMKHGAKLSKPKGRPITFMSPGGVSAGTVNRFPEERAAQIMKRGPLSRLMTRGYWYLYGTYRRARFG